MAASGVANSNTFKVTTPTDLDIHFTRLFDAPPHLVFEAMSKPEHIKRWWGNLGDGYSVPVCEVDLRVGGKWRFVNRHPKGDAEFYGEYREINPPGRIVFTEIYAPFPDAVSVVTAVLSDENGKTRLNATSRYPSKEVRDMVLSTGMEKGAGLSYDRLDEVATGWPVRDNSIQQERHAGLRLRIITAVPYNTAHVALNSRRWFAGSAIALCCGLQVFAQQPTFRASVETVEVDVRVTDRDGRPVAGLTAADFELREDGKRQAISAATFVRLPSTIAASPPETVRPADPGSAIGRDGRAYVIVLDDLHVEARWSSRVVTLVTQFIEHNVTAADRVMIRTTGGGSAKSAFTGERSVLIAATANFIGRKLPPASLVESERRAQSRELSTWTSTDDPFERERAMRARAAMATLQDAASGLRELRGRRKAILLFSEGIDYDVTDAIGRADKGSEADGITQSMRDAVALANQTNASFYAIDPRGSALNADLAASSDVDRDATDAMRRELMMSQASLREVADLTGGAAAVNTNNLTGFFDRIVQDGDSYYMLSYTPASNPRRPAYHKIEVRVAKRGLRVRARPGYLSMPAPVAPTTSAAGPREGAQPSVPAVPPRSVTAAPAPPSLDPDDPELDDVMDRVAAYVGEYYAQLSGVVAEERYHQSVVSMSGPVRGRIGSTGSERDLRSDLLLVRSAGEDQWVQFRDVFEVDGKPLRDRDERLYKLFVEPTPNARRQAEVIQEAGARYNIGPLMRTINVPIMALGFLAEATQPSFQYRRVKAGDLRAFAGVARADDIWVIEYRETAKETLIRGDNNRNIPSRGKLWIEASTGRVLRTELLSEDVQVKAEIAVDYRTQPGADLLMPVEMREHYTLTQLYMRIEGRAT